MQPRIREHDFERCARGGIAGSKDRLDVFPDSVSLHPWHVPLIAAARRHALGWGGVVIIFRGIYFLRTYYFPR